MYLPKSALEKAFSDKGKQTAPVPVRITGNVEAFGVLLASCGWRIQPSPEPDVLFLQAEKDTTSPANLTGL
ncbi:hypothetical protein [Salmonella enterica]|uniref:hypothetical protein n=1 Tax=Salmonella enterica TaxID=28901 RepID=UPI000F952175|nr:hypothetical protein [Salmonella enterica]ECG7009937.1 hypothetical protein [Salmonella enterica subsp. enterica]EDU9994734.1 hypothetical protein [Salmonella enterica subsp. enterica]EEC0602103.1 hypothetical protein [Salmonella enterica subsp. enterica]MBE8624965.1 hypothetical protein [Salmonella enterica subsp. enterica serovar Hvittingfoss]MBE8629510.1 hypothetical protein [Salmonella enterica subsp. enterica serovar Hvittingfoss]